MNRLTHNVARDLECVTAPRVNLGGLIMRENSGLAEGVDPYGLESRQITGHALNRGFDSFEVVVGRQS